MPCAECNVEVSEHGGGAGLFARWAEGLFKLCCNIEALARPCGTSLPVRSTCTWTRSPFIVGYYHFFFCADLGCLSFARNTLASAWRGAPR